MPRTSSGAAAAGPDVPDQPRHSRMPELLRGHGVLIAALVLVAVHLGWRIAVLRDAYFRQDDFEYVARAMEHPFGWEYLTRSHSGQLMPGGFALVWVLTRISAYDWMLTGAVTLLLQAAAALATLRMFQVLFGRRPAILVPLAVYLFTPMAVPAFAWWAAALNAVPLQIALPMAVTAHVRYVRTGDLRAALAAAGWIVLGLAFFLKAAAIPILLLAVTSAYLTFGADAAERPVWPRSILLTLRRHRPAWTLYGIVLAVYIPLYLVSLGSASGTSAGPTADDTATFAGRWLGRTFAVTAVGGPGEWFTVKTGDYAVADPSTTTVVVAWTVIAAVVLITSWFRRCGWRSWAIMLGWLIGVDVLPVIFGRLTSFFAPILGLEARYLADVAPVLTLCLALAAIPIAGEPAPYRRPPPVGWLHPATVGAVTAGYVGLAMWSTYGYLVAVDSGQVRGYMDNARTTLAKAKAGQTIYDQWVPHYVYWGLAGEYAHTRHALAPLARPALRPAMLGAGAAAPSENPMTFDEAGRLRPVTVVGAQADAGPGRCLPQLGGVVNVPLNPPGAGGAWTAQIGYLSARPLRMRLEYGGRPVDVTLRNGLGQVTVPVRGRGPRLVMTPLGPSAGVCVGKVVVGAPTAR